MSGYERTCANWNVYVGWNDQVKRIDVRCLACGRRHQYRPSRTTTRGRKSSLRWFKFPDDVPRGILDLEARRRNGDPGIATLPGFVSALDRFDDTPRERERTHQNMVFQMGAVEDSDYPEPRRTLRATLRAFLAWLVRLVPGDRSRDTADARADQLDSRDHS